MKLPILRFLTYLFCAVFFSACKNGSTSSQDHENKLNEPSDEQIRAFVSERIPDYYNAKIVRSESFIEQESLKGRVSFVAEFSRTKLFHHQKSVLNAVGVEQKYAHRIFEDTLDICWVHEDELPAPVSRKFELEVQKSVDGWDFSRLDVSLPTGTTREKLGDEETIFSSTEFSELLENKRSEVAEEMEKTIQTLTQNKKPFLSDVRFQQKHYVVELKFRKISGRVLRMDVVSDYGFGGILGSHDVTLLNPFMMSVPIESPTGSDNKGEIFPDGRLVIPAKVHRYASFILSVDIVFDPNQQVLHTKNRKIVSDKYKVVSDTRKQMIGIWQEKGKKDKWQFNSDGSYVYFNENGAEAYRGVWEMRKRDWPLDVFIKGQGKYQTWTIVSIEEDKYTFRAGGLNGSSRSPVRTGFRIKK